MRGYISSFEDLEKWFTPLNCIEWSLYHGFQKGRLNNSNLVFKNEDTNLDSESSFERLKEMIEMSSTGGGQFTVYVPYKSNNTGVKAYFGTGLNGTGQPAQVTGLPGVYGGIEQYVQKEKKMWELEAMVNGLLEEKEQEKSTVERIFDKVMDDLDMNQVATALIGLIGNLIPPKVPVTMQGTPQEMNPDQGPIQEGYEYNSNIVLPILDTIRQHFESNDEFYSFLQKVAIKFNDQPGFFKQMIGNE